MTTYANEAVIDVTARLRGRDIDRPVRVGHDPESQRVVVLLDLEHAHQLAKLLAQVDSNPSRQRDHALTVTKDDQDVWMHALVDILAARSLAAEAVHHVPPATYAAAVDPPTHVRPLRAVPNA
jgi:hypothetical protein